LTTKWSLRILTVLVIAGLGWWLPTLFFDDAYITFRYAANIAHGEGFSYNPPERVLGATTPLLTLLLAAAAKLGFDIESAALVYGLIGHAMLCLAVFEAMRWLVPEGISPAVLGALACALHPHLAFTAVGGMETSLYCAWIVLALTAAASGGVALTAAFLGAALLTRPDAVLILAPAIWLLLRHRRAGRDQSAASPVTLAAAGAVLVMTAGWLLFATWYFGSPVPHSIAAKRLIHPYGPGQVLAELGRFLSDDYYLIVALPLAVWGVAATRRPLARGLALFVLLYLTTLVFGGVEPFAWYINPPIPIVLALAAAGLADLLARAGLRGPRAATGAWVLAAVTVVTAVVMTLDLRRQAPGLRDDWDAWEGTYEIAARWLMNESQPGDRIYVGETGVIGYLLPHRLIIDSSGINSPEVTRLRTGLPERNAEWSRRIIRELKPDFITTSTAYLNIKVIAGEPWFVELYEKVDAPLVEREGQVIYRLRRVG